MKTMRSKTFAVLCGLGLPLVACSAEAPDTSGGSGGAAGSSGAPTFGGQVVTSGGAAPTSGGATTSAGGASSSGGTSNGGASTSGGTLNGGGAPTSGGTSNGGAANGGASVNGGSGGAVTSGGASTGGAKANGGAATSGGATAKGGASSSGGTSAGGAVGAGGSSNPQDCGALATIKSYAPTDSELLELFNDYVSTELGTVQCAAAAPAGTTRTITQTIFVPPGVTYDGKGEKLTADATAMKCDLTEGEQGESQRPYFLLAPGASVKNVTIAYPGCDGIHMMGNNVLDNISWENVGEDAASVRSYFPGGDILIKDSDSKSSSDKTFQFNAGCKVRIENFTGSDMGKLVRQNGDTTFELHIDLNTVNVTGVVSAVIQSDSPLCFVRHHALTYAFTGSGDKSDRVFRDVPAGNVTAY